MDKIEIMQYLIDEANQMRQDLPKMEKYHAKAHKRVEDWYEKHNNYNLTFKDAWREVWGVKTIPTKAKIKENMKKVRQLALEISKEM